MIKKPTLLIETQYFGSIYYYSALAAASHIIIEQWENFKKLSFRNRCTIIGSNGLIDLSVPLKGGREQKCLVKDVQIDNDLDWRKRHIRSIRSSYSRAPFYEYYADKIFSLVEKPHTHLLQLNDEIMQWVMKVLKLKTAIDFSATFIAQPADMKDMRNVFLPRNREHLSANLPAYHQVFEDKHGFQPGLSILDLLFNQGPASAGYLHQLHEVSKLH